MYPKRLDDSFDLAFDFDKLSAWLSGLPAGLYYTKDLFKAYTAAHGVSGGRHWRLFSSQLPKHGLYVSRHNGCTIARKADKAAVI